MSNQIGFTDDMVEPQKGFFPIAECIDNVELSSIEYEVGDFGPQVKMEFTRSEGVSEDRLLGWKSIPTEGNVRAKEDETDREALIRATKKFNTYMKHIANQFPITEEDLADCNGDTVKETVENLCNLITERSQGVKLWMKTFRKKGTEYAQIPPYPKFLQPMEEGVECQLRYSEKERKRANAGSPSKTVETADEADIDF